jgi:hypothetical protein
MISLSVGGLRVCFVYHNRVVVATGLGYIGGYMAEGFYLFPFLQLVVETSLLS